jgi:hypothetical protein
MTEGPGAEGARGQDLSGFGELERRVLMEWVGENLPHVRRSVYGQRLLYRSLVVGFVLGLAVHVGGYALRASVSTGPLGLAADLLYALGYALWTGVVVAVFVQVFPEVKRRQFKEVLDAYEAAQRDQASRDDEAPTAG